MVFPFIRKAYRAVKKIFKGRRRVVVARKMRPRRKYNTGGQLTVKKTIKLARLSVLGNATVFQHETFELVDMPQYAAYVGLYEEYKIEKVVYKITSLNNMALANQTASNLTLPFCSLGMIHTNIDHNDSSTPTSIQELMNDNTYRNSRSSKNHTRVLVPRFLNSAGGSQAQSKTGWLKCEFDSISHYGLKIAYEGGITSLSGAVSYIVEPEMTFYVSFRNPK